MPRFEDLEVHIQIRCPWGSDRGRKMREYQTESVVEEHTTIMSCCVASEVGKEFSVEWRSYDPEADMVIRIYMDGQFTDEVAHFRDEKAGGSRGVILDQADMRRYYFGSVQLTDDETVAEPGCANKDLGIIEVCCWNVKNWRKRRQHKTMDYELADVTDQLILHKKDKIDGGHIVCFGPPKSQPRHTSGFDVYLPVDLSEHPFVTFRFRYRPEAVLRSEGILFQQRKKRRSTSSWAGRSSELRRRVSPDSVGHSHNLSLPPGEGTEDAVSERENTPSESEDGSVDIELPLAAAQQGFEDVYSEMGANSAFEQMDVEPEPAIAYSPQGLEQTDDVPHDWEKFVRYPSEQARSATADTCDLLREANDEIKQEELDHLDVIISEAQERKRELLSVKREASPIRVPVDCEVIDLT